jgi:hypothetical protein
VARALADGLLRRLDLREGVELVASDSQRFAGGWTVRWRSPSRPWSR